VNYFTIKNIRKKQRVKGAGAMMKYGDYGGAMKRNACRGAAATSACFTDHTPWAAAPVIDVIEARFTSLGRLGLQAGGIFMLLQCILNLE
jgi:hypothetical protein